MSEKGTKAKLGIQGRAKALNRIDILKGAIIYMHKSKRQVNVHKRLQKNKTKWHCDDT